MRDRSGGTGAGVAATLSLLLSGLAACGGGEPSAAPAGSPAGAVTTPAGSPSPTPDPFEAAAAAEIFAAYQGFREAEIALNAHPPEPGAAAAALAGYVAEPLLSRLNGHIYLLYVNDLARAGESTVEPELAELHLDEEPAWATIRDCLDTTGWRLVDRETGQPASADSVVGLYAAEPGRHPRVLTAVRYDVGWRIEDSAWQRDETC